MDVYYAAGGRTRYKVTFCANGCVHAYFYIKTDRQIRGMRSCKVPCGAKVLDWVQSHYRRFGTALSPFWDSGLKGEEERMRGYLLEYHSQPTFDLDD